MGLDIWLKENTDCFRKSLYKKECIKQLVSLSALLDLDKLRADREWENVEGKYPDHLCTPTYLRSSYNSTGYNRIAKHLGLMDLYDIFDPIFVNIPGTHEFYTDCSKEKLNLCLDNALNNLFNWLQLNNQVMDYYIDNIPNDDKIYSEKEIIDSIKSQLNTDKEFLEGIIGRYASPDMLKEPTIYCVIPNVELWEGSNFKGNMVVFKNDIVWYKQMAEIIVEFIENALTMEEPNIVFWG